MAQRRKKRRSTRKPAKTGTSPIVSMFFGLAVGLSVAVAVYMKDRRPAAEPMDAPTPVSMQSTIDALDNNGETATTASGSNEPEGAQEEEAKEKRFTFYDILPNVEVVTPEQALSTETSTEPQAVVEPGLYVLQAGSFSTNADAERRRAELGLHGIESITQRVKVNDRNYHRVYVGPTADLDELNMLRSRLRAAKIDVLRIRLSD